MAGVKTYQVDWSTYLFGMNNRPFLYHFDPFDAKQRTSCVQVSPGDCTIPMEDDEEGVMLPSRWVFTPSPIDLFENIPRTVDGGPVCKAALAQRNLFAYNFTRPTPPPLMATATSDQNDDETAADLLSSYLECEDADPFLDS